VCARADYCINFPGKTRQAGTFIGRNLIITKINQVDTPRRVKRRELCEIYNEQVGRLTRFYLSRPLIGARRGSMLSLSLSLSLSIGLARCCTRSNETEIPSGKWRVNRRSTDEQRRGLEVSTGDSGDREAGKIRRKFRSESNARGCICTRFIVVVVRACTRTGRR